MLSDCFCCLIACLIVWLPIIFKGLLFGLLPFPGPRSRRPVLASKFYLQVLTPNLHLWVLAPNLYFTGPGPQCVFTDPDQKKNSFNPLLLKRQKCDFIKVAKQLYWNCTSAWVFSCKFTAYFQKTFSQEHLWVLFL